ncbi:casein kinase substrate phosphoprotein PP28 domain-containing protein [Trichoderma velutinum]
MPGAPGSSSRGRGGKFRKFTRGGGKHFSRNLQPLDSEGNAVSMWGENAKKRNEDEEDSEEESEEESEEDEDEDEAGPAAAAASGDANREDRKAQKKARKEAAIAKQKNRIVEVGDLPSSSDEESDAELPANPNHSSSARKQATKPADVETITEGVKKLPASRREREAAEAAAAKERYMKLHAEGKTDEAKADIARLKLIRAQREADAARRQAEKEEREEREKERRAEIEAREAKLRALAAAPPSKKSGKKK